jgi:acetoin utilization protein AcuB
MTREVATLGPQASAAEALGRCREHGIRHLPVVEDGRLVGLVSDRDLRDVSPPRGTSDAENTLSWVRLVDIMTRGVETAHPLDTIEHAAHRMHVGRIGCLPVVADGELAGIVTSSDMMQTLTELVGAGERGSWVEVEVPNEPGSLAGVSKLVGERGVNIAGIFLSPAKQSTHRMIVLRLERTDPSGVAKALSEAGYRAYGIEPSSPVSTGYEES